MDTTQEQDALFDTTDLILLSALGLGTAAWFSRHQLKDLFFGKKKVLTPTAGSGTAQKRETNFVKVMQQQVSFKRTRSFSITCPFSKKKKHHH